MSPKYRIVYRNWIVAVGFNPPPGWEEQMQASNEASLEIINGVTRVLETLSPAERDFVRLYYMQGMTYRQTAHVMNRNIRRLPSLNTRIRKKLTLRLARELGRKYFLPEPQFPDCPLCNHPRADDINDIIRSRKESDTWRPIIRILRDRYDLPNICPRRLMGHSKYHMT